MLLTQNTSAKFVDHALKSTKNSSVETKQENTKHKKREYKRIKKGVKKFHVGIIFQVATESHSIYCVANNALTIGSFDVL